MDNKNICANSNKITELEEIMEKYCNEDVMVAFSGGVDSSLLLHMAVRCAGKLGKSVYAVTLHTMLHPLAEMDSAKSMAAKIGAKHIVIQIDELNNAGIMDNPSDRCYLCKKHLFEKVVEKADELGISTILEGTNKEDTYSYRPGIRALSELGIKSPLMEADFTKEDVRKSAAMFNIQTANKPSSPCLATRFPYGVHLSYEEMRKVEKGEAYLRGFGFYNVRLRVHNDVVRIEVDEENITGILDNKASIIQYLKSIGYRYITIDLEGFRSGSFDN